MLIRLRTKQTEQARKWQALYKVRSGSRIITDFYRLIQQRFSGALALESLKAILPACLTAGLALCAPLYAQVTTATLGGIVTDVTGAVVPQAQVMLKNEASRD